MRLTMGRRDDHLRCRQAQRLLQSYLDGELPADRADLVAAHLEACHRCGLDAETFRQVKEAVGDLRRDVDPEAVQRLHAFVDGLTEDG